MLRRVWPLASPNGAYADFAQPTPPSGECTATPMVQDTGTRTCSPFSASFFFLAWLPAERVHRAATCCLFNSHAWAALSSCKPPTRLQVGRGGTTVYVSDVVENTIS
ncbi:hypothetical protein B0H11DRAFT_2231266 [Mycena galericulata]|nr:hypothetical protein B0H11DRAFT_2231266 [Mycena galericulata]